MGIRGPLTVHQIGEAVPPAMAEWIGRSMLDQSRRP